MRSCSVKAQFKERGVSRRTSEPALCVSVLRIIGFTASSALADVRCQRRSLSMKNIRKSHARTYSNRV